MSFDHYQMAAMRTKPNFKSRRVLSTTQQEQITQLNNAALGLTGEAGEFADLLKKIQYQEAPFEQEKLIKELGDILWYITLAADALHISLEEIAQTNIQKLLKRYPDGFSGERSNNRKKEDT